MLTIVGDPHFKPENLHKQEKIFELVEFLGNPTVILGDLLHTKEIIKGSCINTLINLLKKSKLHFYILIGNHDYFNLQCTEHSLEPLKLLPNVTIIDTPREIIIENIPCYFIPYTHSIEVFKNRVDIAKLQHKPEILFLHQGINNFDFGNGFIETNGTELKDLSSFPLIISGHFHKYQAKDNLLYLGTPFSHDFGEANQDKFLATLNIPAKEINLIPTKLEQHRTWYIKTPEDLKNISDINPTDSNRIIIEGKKEDFVSVDYLPFKSQGIQIIEKFSNSTFEQLTLNPPENSLDFFLTWAKEVKKLPEGIIAAGIQILKNV